MIVDGQICSLSGPKNKGNPSFDQAVIRYSREKFRTAGHNAPTSLETALPKEEFFPIQRVVDKEKDNRTVGYLYHDVEYKGTIGDIILSQGWLRDEIDVWQKKKLMEWQAYEQDKANTFKWAVPSGPLVMELLYRSQQDNSPLAKEAWQNTFDDSAIWVLPTSTRIYCCEKTARIRHNWTEKEQETAIPKDQITILTDTNDPAINQFLNLLLGKRYAAATRIFGQYGTLVKLWASSDKNCTLVLGADGRDYFNINAENNLFYDCNRPARCITLASNILSNPRYEVRDE